MGSNLTGDDQRILEKSVAHVGGEEPTLLSAEELHVAYEINRSVKIIQEKGFQKVALQFPDELMHHSIAVATRLRLLTGKTVFILADTTFGSTDVDEIAAEHGDADFIIHYGRATLNPNARIPVQYVFGRKTLDLQDCLSTFRSFYESSLDQAILVLYDVVYHHATEALKGMIVEGGFTRTVMSTVVTEWLRDIAPGAGEVEVHETPESVDSPLKGRQFKLFDNTRIEDYRIFYIGEESTTLSSIMMRLNKCQFATYDPVKKAGRLEGLGVSKALMRRYALVEKAKDAGVIGIVVGTLGIAGYLNVVDNLKRLIKAAGKKSFTFVMGKLNVAKMANFLEIDIFVLVASPENSLIDSKEFLKPIITPFELEIALTIGKEWTGEYIVDFQELLPGLEKSVELQEKASQEDGEDDVSSQVQDLTLRNRNNQLTLGNTAAGDFLARRTFQGLEQRTGETPVTLAVEGRKGIAKGYHNPGESDGKV